MFPYKFNILKKISMKNGVEILMGLVLNQYIAFIRMIIFRTLILLIYEHMRSFFGVVKFIL